jgi:hypothetical protein
MGVTGIIVLRALKRGEPELSPSLKTKSFSLGDSSGMACGIPLSDDHFKSWVSHRRLEWAWCWLKACVTSGDNRFRWMREPLECLEEKHATNPPSWCTNCWCFLHRQDIGWQRSRVPIPRWSCELLRTRKHTIVYPGSGPFYKVIAVCPAFWYWGWVVVTMGLSKALKKFATWKGEMILFPLT